MVSVFIYKPIFVSTTASSSTTTVQTSSKYLDILPESVDASTSVIDAIFDTASQSADIGVIISANSQQNLIDVNQGAAVAAVINRDEIPYNSKTVQKFTVVHDKVWDLD